ncbi:unnamed protein product [Closterium sp. Naga37s-1]|nr:unnamed protein product [Closterium sp. Naga37s-1]
MMDPSPTPTDTTPFDTLTDDLAILIFQRLASSVTFSHAFVCSRWLRLARVSQCAVHVARRRGISGAQLIRAVSRMPNLSSLDLSNGSVDSITDAFLAGLAKACPQLSSLSLTAGGHGSSLSHSSLGLEALFSTCTRLQQLRLHGTAAGVTSLPSPLLHLQQLKTLHLSMDHLRELPPAFGLLSSLTHLNLHTPLLQFLPPTLGRLRDLESFELVDCDSLVSLPECIGQLSKLSHLGVSSSSLVLLPDSISLLSLTSLDLILPALSLLPASLGHSSLSTSLSLLALTICTTLHSLPASLPSLHTLTTIEISQCSLSALPDDFGFLPALQTLELNACEELSRLPDSFPLLPSLTNLSITGCPTLLSLPENFGHLSCLKIFELCSVAKVACLPDSFGQLEALQEVCGAAMGKRGDVMMAARAAVVALLVARCCMLFARAAPVVDAEMEALENLAHECSDVYNRNTWMRDRDCDSMYAVRCDDDGHVIELVISECSLVGSLPTALLALPHLKELTAVSIVRHLSSHDSPGELPAWIFSLTNLTSLDIQGNNFSGSIPEAISSLKQLRELRITEPTLSGSIPESIGALTNLQDLNLRKCGLSGSIPEAISSLKQLEMLDLQGNSLSGTIPAFIGRLTELRILKLNDNAFSGSIPGTFCNHIRFCELDFEGNQFTRELPSFDHTAHLNIFPWSYSDLTATGSRLPLNATGGDEPSQQHSLSTFQGATATSQPPVETNLYNSAACVCNSFCILSLLSSKASLMPACSPPVPSTPSPICCFFTCIASSLPPSLPLLIHRASTNPPCEPPDTAVVEEALSVLQAPPNLLLLQLLPLAVLLQLALALSLAILRRLKNRPPTCYFFSKRALAARQAAMGVEITCE